MTTGCVPLDGESMTVVADGIALVAEEIATAAAGRSLDVGRSFRPLRPKRTSRWRA